MTKFFNTLLKALAIAAIILQAYTAQAAQGKLLATSGLIQIEGAGGGGIVPWATLSGYDSQDEISLSSFMTYASLQDYKLQAFGASASFYDTVEVSVAKHTFDLGNIGPDISQTIIGIKYKVFADAVYSDWPQISLGAMHKSLQDTAIAKALGASSTSGTDFYVAATKIHLSAIAGYNAVWSFTARATKANEMGLLGFGSAQHNSYKMMLEASAGILLSKSMVVGMEYRQKPDNLGLNEDDWLDYFVSYSPSKSFSLTLAWADLGVIAGAPKQQGFYLSFTGHLH